MGFNFATPTTESVDFCEEVLAAMVTKLDVSRGEALLRLNKRWAGVDFEEDDLRYHESPEFWAQDIYYGHDSLWWQEPSDLAPLPLD